VSQDPDGAPQRDAPAGWYGKIPAVGDFVTRRLPPVFVDAWDDWLAGELAAARAAMDAQWPQRFDAAPAWCFVLTPGLIDGYWWYGCWQASVDRVGRRFGLCFAKPGAEGPPQLAWWPALVAAGALAAQPGTTADDVEGALAAAGAPALAPSPGLSTAMAGLVDARGASFWCPLHGADPRPELAFTCAGWPRGAAFARLLPADSI